MIHSLAIACVVTDDWVLYFERILVLAQRLAREGFGVEVYVLEVGTGKSTEVVKKMRAYDGVSVVYELVEEQPTFPAGINMLWRKISRLPFDACINVNRSVNLTYKAIKNLVSYLAKHPQYGAVTGRWYEGKKVMVGGGRRRAFLGWLKSIGQADWIDERFLVVRKACIEQVGGFEERLFKGRFVSWEWCRRLMAGGWQVKVLPSMVGRFLPTTSGNQFLGGYFEGRNGFLVLGKDYSWLELWLLLIYKTLRREREYLRGLKEGIIDGWRLTEQRKMKG